MSLATFIDNLAGLDLAIKRCLEERLALPGLVLIYSGFDIMASMERRHGEAVGPSFCAWVERYALKARPLTATAVDLYAARCGLLHTYSAESDLARAGKARKLIYAWGSASAQDLQEAANRTGRSELVAVHVEDLRWALLEGIHLWYQDVLQAPDRLTAVEATSDLWFSHMPKEVVSQFLTQTAPPAV